METTIEGSYIIASIFFSIHDGADESTMTLPPKVEAT